MNPDEINALIDHWCPEFSRKEEPRDIQIMRAFLAATACARMQAEVIAGRVPMRPLSSFPNPSFIPLQG